nr:hypothetical protein [Tanacetum cinerariifolium]
MRTSKHGESNTSVLEDPTLRAGNPVKEILNLPDHMYNIYTVKRSLQNQRYKSVLQPRSSEVGFINHMLILKLPNLIIGIAYCCEWIEYLRITDRPLGLGYGALRHREITLREGQMPSVFEVGQSSRLLPESERPERVSALRQPTLTTWINPKDGIAYINVLAYPPPAPHVQTLPSLEWSFGSLLISPAPSIVPSPISSPMISLTGGLIHDHTILLGELSPALFERYDRDIKELFTRSGEVRDEIFFQMYDRDIRELFAVTFGVIWRPIVALESWEGQTNAQRAAMWHAISDTQGENQELRL